MWLCVVFRYTSGDECTVRPIQRVQSDVETRTAGKKLIDIRTTRRRTTKRWQRRVTFDLQSQVNGDAICRAPSLRLHIAQFVSILVEKSRLASVGSAEITGLDNDGRITSATSLQQRSPVSKITSNITVSKEFIMAALWNRAGHYISSSCGFFLSISYLLYFSSPNLSGRRMDV